MSLIPRPVLSLLRLVRMGFSQADCDLRANRYCMLMVRNFSGESSCPRQIQKRVVTILQSPSQQRLTEKEAAVREPAQQTGHEERRSCDMAVLSRSHSSAQQRE